MTITTKFELGDFVVMDGSTDIRARVTQFSFGTHGVNVECSWFHNGEAKFAWFAEWRLEKA